MCTRIKKKSSISINIKFIHRSIFLHSINKFKKCQLLGTPDKKYWIKFVHLTLGITLSCSVMMVDPEPVPGTLCARYCMNTPRIGGYFNAAYHVHAHTLTHSLTPWRVASLHTVPTCFFGLIINCAASFTLTTENSI